MGLPRVRSLSLFVAGLLLAAGCAEEEEIVPTDLRWEPDIRPLVERTCLPCHSRADTLKGPNAHGHNYESYERVRRARKAIYETVVLERSMPESNAVGIALSEAEVRRIGAWIRGG
ncbi:MAG: hypothetical protein GF328_02285, partial [Candidatus Latescibacteria bacterium]|nr:hypothetical protein [Candidatus Latescibacterota bacterium]